MLTSFITAARSGDMSALERLFAADVASLSDGNGAYQVSRHPVAGAHKVAQFLATISSWFWAEITVTWATTNGQTSAVLRRGQDLYGVLTVTGSIGTGSPGTIDQVLWIVNPEKLARFS